MKRKLIYKLELKVVFNILITFILSALTMAVLYMMWKFFLAIGAISSLQSLDEIYKARRYIDFTTIIIALMDNNFYKLFPFIALHEA